MQSVFRLLVRAAVVALAAAAAMAIGGGASAAAASPCGHLRRAPAWHHIVVIAFENHSYNQILGKSAPASYFKTLAGECGSATDFTAAHFPRSLGNYLAATGGRVVTGDRLHARAGVRERRAEHLQPGRRPPLAHLRRVDAAALLPQRYVGVRPAPRPGAVLPAHPPGGVSQRHGHPAPPPAEATADVHVDRAEPAPRHARRHPRLRPAAGCRGSWAAPAACCTGARTRAATPPSSSGSTRPAAAARCERRSRSSSSRRPRHTGARSSRSTSSAPCVAGRECWVCPASATPATSTAPGCRFTYSSTGRRLMV